MLTEKLILRLTYQVFSVFYYMNISNQPKHAVMNTKYRQSEGCKLRLLIEFSGKPVGENVHVENHRSY